MPQADSTEATVGTITRGISSSRATSTACSPAAPPKLSSAKRRGSTPRRSVIRRMPSAIFRLISRKMPAAVSSRDSFSVGGDAVDRRLARGAVELARAAEEIVGVEIAEQQVGVGDRRLRAAMAVAGRARDRAGAFRADLKACRVDAGDRAAAGADAGDVEAAQRDALAGEAALGGQLRLAAGDQRDVGARCRPCRRG